MGLRMSKYSPLGDYLRGRQTNEVPLSFHEIEEIIGRSLPPKAQNYAAWWSNNPSNNVMTKVWLEAGFRTERVDLGGRRLVFRRAARPPSSLPQGTRPERHAFVGAMKGTFTIPDDLDLTEPADPEWGKVYE